MIQTHASAAGSALILALATHATWAVPARAQLDFDAVTVDSSGPSNLWGKTVGDLNADGLPDLVAGGRKGGGLVWYQNPNWTKRTIASSGAFSTDHELCDVDSDGDQDVVSLQASSLHWYEAPTWVEHTISNSTLHDIEAFDFDGDGDCDVVARNQGSFGGDGSTLYLFTQSSPDSWVRTTRTIPDGEGLLAADIDGDADLDLVLNEVWIENRGVSLGASAEHSYGLGWDHESAFLAVGDIDNDGNRDIVIAPAERDGDSYRISWFEAPSDPRQTGWTEHIVDDGVEAVHHFVGTGDFDGDGDIDIAAAEMEQGSGADEVKIYRNDGGAFTKVVIAETGSHSMRVVDIDLDGDLDLFGANWESSRVELFINQTPPKTLALDAWRRHVIDANRPGRAIFITTEDLDGDNREDVAAGGYWYRNPGSAAGVWTRSAFGAPLNNLAVLDDLDGDGDIDVLGTDGNGSEIAPDFAYARNDGQGSFTVVGGVAVGSGDFLQGVTVARLSPGEAKRVVLSWHSKTSVVEALTVPSDPVAGFWANQSLSGSSQGEQVSHGDIDRDGDQDLLLGTAWMENLGTSWSQRTLFQTSDDPDRNRLGDIDRDGRLDAVVGYQAISTKGTLAWYRQPQDPAGSWSQNVIAELTGPMSVDVADMDRDGDLDVVVGEHNLSKPANAGLYVFENLDGAGSSWRQHSVHVGDEHHDGAQVVDIDRDGDLDIVSIGWGHNRVLLYENVATSSGGSGSSGGGAGGGGPDMPCSDGLDNDGDGNTDYPEDRGCRNAEWGTEAPECDDGLDNEGDGLIDAPDDTKCLARWDINEGSALEANLVAGWGFEEVSPTVVDDSSGNGYNGTLAGAATRSDQGYHGKALETDGTSGHVDIGRLDLTGTRISVMAWVNADDFGNSDARILSKSSSVAEQDHLWMLSTVGGSTLRFRLATNGVTSTIAGGALAPGSWAHVAATYDGAAMRLYQDGVLVASQAKFGSVDADPTMSAWIGANPGQSDQVFDGRIDEVKLYNRALSPAEITREMISPLQPMCSVGYPGDAPGTPLVVFALLLLAYLAKRTTRFD